MITGDICDIEGRLKEIDPEITLNFNPNNGNYPVFHKGYYVMEWPRPLDARLIRHMQRIDSRRGYSAIEEIDAHNDKLERTIEKDRLNYLEAVIKDNKRQLMREL